MGAGRPVSIVEVEARACPLRQLRRCFHSYRASSVPRSGLGSCDRRHGLLFEYPSFFGCRVRAALISAQIATPAFSRSRWNLLTIAVFFFSHWATAAERGDDRVSDKHAERHENIYHNGSSGFGGNAASAERADLGAG